MQKLIIGAVLGAAFGVSMVIIIDKVKKENKIQQEIKELREDMEDLFGSNTEPANDLKY